jgi:CxxC-x17-CxxC domain-containing protein
VLYSDRTITCSDCGADFPFSAAEQEFFEQKGFRFPRRCKECRKAKKDGGGGGGGARAGGGPGGEPRGETWPAVCTQCGAETTVPFKPDPARPTFCRKCYGERKTARTR